MYSEVDEGKGLVKCYWKDVREQVAKVEPRFAALVDQIDPGKEFPVYKAYYPYGMTIADTEHAFIRGIDNRTYRINEIPKTSAVYKDLAYGMNSLPAGMVLNKSIEHFIDRPDEQISMPWRISLPGQIAASVHMLTVKKPFYMPSGILKMVSGARSTFLLPNIGCATQHSNLQRDFNVKLPPPKTLYEEFFIFKEILESSIIDCHWQSCILFFSEQWINAVQNKEQWKKLKMYLYEEEWLKSEYHRSKIYYDIIFSVLQKKRNLKPNPYLMDTAEHLFSLALGDSPGYMISNNDSSIPARILQQVYTESYGLKKYYPHIIHPGYFDYQNSKTPIYYSFQYPSTYIFSPKSRNISSILYDLRELEHLVSIFQSELSDNSNIAANTIMCDVAEIVKFRYFHNKSDRHNIIQSSTEIPSYDDNIKIKHKQASPFKPTFAADAPFARGCVSIGTSN